MAFALFILYLALSYLYPGELLPELAPYRATYWVGMAALAAAIAAHLCRKDGPLTNIQLWLLLLFTAVMGLSLAIAEEWLGAPIAALQRFGPSLTMFVLAMCTVTSLVRLRIAAGCVIALTIALMLQGAAAYHFGFNSRLFLLDRAPFDVAQGGASEDVEADVMEEQPDPDRMTDELEDFAGEDDWSEVPRIRALGFMHDPNDLAVGMIVALGLIGGAWKPRLQLRHLLLAAAAGALVYGVYLTRSRGGAVALVVVLWRLAACHFGRGPALGLLGALGAGLMTLDFGGRSLAGALDESSSARLDAWTEGLEMLKSQPIFGVGYGQFVDHHTLTAHNALVLSFAETGLLGCFLWVGLLVVTMLELHRLKTLPGTGAFEGTTRQWAQALQLSLIGFMAAAFFLSRTFVPTLYLVIGLSVALAAIARSANKSIPLPSLPGLGMLVLACELGSIGIVYAIVKLYVV
jgi:putative inorganic carbon (HCO3(-)) transporter